MKTANRRIAMAAFAVIGAMTVQGARAAVLFDNGGDSIAGGDYINADSYTSGLNNGPLVDSFSTGASGFTLDEVDVNLGAGSGSGTISVALYSDDSTLPGTSLETLGTISESAVTGSSGTYAFSSFTPYSLAPGTRYWIELTDSDPSTESGASAVWNFTGDGTGTDAGSDDLSGEYYLNSNYPGVAQSDTAGPYMMTLSGESSTPMPEPATLGILGMGLAGLRTVRRRRRSL